MFRREPSCHLVPGDASDMVAEWRSGGSQVLNRLPDRERAAWQALWRDVDELAKRVAKNETVKK